MHFPSSHVLIFIIKVLFFFILNENGIVNNNLHMQKLLFRISVKKNIFLKK